MARNFGDVVIRTIVVIGEADLEDFPDITTKILERASRLPDARIIEEDAHTLVFVTSQNALEDPRRFRELMEWTGRLEKRQQRREQFDATTAKTTSATRKTTMTDDIIDDYALNTYEVLLPLDLREFNTLEELELTIVDVVADSIVDHVDALDEDDAPYVTTQVTYEDAEVRRSYEDDETDIAVVQTRTQLGIIDD